jgi:hypothetical protein
MLDPNGNGSPRSTYCTTMRPLMISLVGPGIPAPGEIRRIYEDSAPLISSAMKPPARAFVAVVVGIESMKSHFLGGVMGANH